VRSGEGRTAARSSVTVVATPTVGNIPGASPGVPAVRLVDVTTGYGQRVALANVSLSIRAGSLLAVIGPNGAGKSTLLKTIAGLLRPFSGTVEVLGGPPGREARRIAYVPQAEVVDWGFPVTVGDVVMMGRVPLIGVGRSPAAEDRTAVRDALETVGMSDAVNRQIGALSGGQRRRVFLARAIAARPDLYLLDEPVTGVDATTQEDLMDVLEAEARTGRTVVATTHDLACAAHRFHQAAFVNGRIVATGSAEMVLDPDVLAATYGGHVIVLPAGGRTLIDDAHHHDDAPAGERHFHDGSG
jgi:ABC-type Mn2+/Zn2+ transport system ATPase subunit